MKRTAIFVAIVLAWALLAAAMAYSATFGREITAFPGFAPGTVVVKTSDHRLYYVLDEGARCASRSVSAAAVWPRPELYASKENSFDQPGRRRKKFAASILACPQYAIPGGAADNPMGAAALTLRGGKYAIHGTNRPASVGTFVSYGCIRMSNRDIVELCRLVDIGTPVIVER